MRTSSQDWIQNGGPPRKSAISRLHFCKCTTPRRVPVAATFRVLRRRNPKPGTHDSSILARLCIVCRLNALLKFIISIHRDNAYYLHPASYYPASAPFVRLYSEWQELALFCRCLVAVIAVIGMPYAVYLQVSVSVNTTGHAPVASTPAPHDPPCTSPMSPIPTPSPCIPCAPPEPVPCTSLSPSSSVQLSKISYVNRTEEKIVERIVYVEVPGPERIVYVEKIVQVNHTVEKIVEVPKSIFVEKNRTCWGVFSDTLCAR